MSTSAPQPDPLQPAPAKRSRGWIYGLIAGGCVLLLVLVTGIAAAGFYLARSASESASSGPEVIDWFPASHPSGDGSTDPYLTFVDPAAEDPVVVDVYLDYLCPFCRLFSQTNSQDLQDLVESGEAEVRIHPRPMLDARSNPEGYSGRAANAAACAYAQDPSLFWAAEETLFAHQPAEDGPGLTDQELTDLMTGIGAGPEVEQCIAEGTHLEWVGTVELDALDRGVQGTPAVYIDGEVWNEDWRVPGALTTAVEAA